MVFYLKYIVIMIILCIMVRSIQPYDEPKKKQRKVGGKGRKGTDEGGSKSSKTSYIRVALDAWVASFIPEVDYNVTQWRYHFRSISQSVYFDHYVRKLSDVFKNANGQVNFVMVGACDGMTDPLIKFRFLKYDHWRGVFVEPMSINVRDLRKFLDENGASNRSHIIQAAATAVCENPTIDVERPLYEEKGMAQNKTLPHWLRRQIGSILPKNRDKPRAEWTIETVACKTAADILKDWAAAVPNVRPDGKVSKVTKRRPHVLKIDVEGHDFQVLTGFVNDKTPTSDLPLLIEFEAKSIAERYPELKELLERKGYVVSEFGQDGFALLRGEYVIAQRKKKDQQNKEEEESGSKLLG